MMVEVEEDEARPRADEAAGSRTISLAFIMEPPVPEDMFPGVVQRLSDIHLRRNVSAYCQVHAVSLRISTVRVHLSLSRARTWHLIRPVNATEASPFQSISASSSAGGQNRLLHLPLWARPGARSVVSI
jgi:hypothetical protein